MANETIEKNGIVITSLKQTIPVVVIAGLPVIASCIFNSNGNLLGNIIIAYIIAIPILLKLIRW